MTGAGPGGPSAPPGPAAWPPAPPGPAAWPPGDPRRPLIRRAVLGTEVASALFVGCGFAAKQVQPLAARSPWQDDPYDLAVSFTVFFVALIAGLCVVRALAFRRDQPMPLRRAADLLRAGRLALATIAVTLAADWASVAAGAHRAAWDGVTGWMIAGLAVLTLLTAAVAVTVRRAARAVAGRAGAPRSAPGWPAPGPAEPPLGGSPAGAGPRPPSGSLPGPAAGQGPDWLADALSVASAGARRLGPLSGPARRVVGWLGDRGCPAVRNHPLGLSAVIAGAFGAAVAANHAAAEGGGIGPVEWLFLAVGFCGMYAFLVAAGSYLRLVRSGRPASGWRRRLIVASVAGCASVPAALGFRASLSWLVPGSGGAVPRLAALLLVVAGTVFTVTLAATAAGWSARPRPGRAA